MNTTEDIRILIDRFFDGDTTLKEEQRLYEFFQGPVPADLEELRPVFQGFAHLGQKQEKRPKSVSFTRRKTWAAAAAVVAVALGTGIWLKEARQMSIRHLPHPTLCEAFVYGQHITDSTEVMNQVAVTLQALTPDPGITDVDNQLKTIFTE